MSGFWSAFEDKKSSHKSIRELAQEHASHFEFSTYHDVNSFRENYRPFQGPEVQYTDPSDYWHMHRPPQGENEHFYSAPPIQSSSLDHLISRIEVLEARKFGENVAPKSSRPIVCVLCRSTNHLAKHCPEVFAFRQSRVDHANFFHQMQENTYYSQTCDLEYIDNPHFAWADDHLQGNPYGQTTECPFFSDPHEKSCAEYPSEMRTPSVEEPTPIEQLNMLLKMNLVHLHNEGREEFQKEMFASSNELHYENSVFSPTHATDIEYESNLEVIESTRDTMGLNRTLHSCYDDDDDDDILILEEHVCTENVVMESSVSETLGSIVVTSTNDVSSDFLIRNIELLDDEDTDTVQLNCEREHDTQLVPDLGNVELSVASSGFLMLEIETLDDHATDLGLVDLFYECEHAATLVDDLGGIDETNNDVPTPLHVSQTETLRPDIELVCNEFVKPTMLRVPNLGLELCASQILLDHFASKYNIFKEPQLEYVSLPIPEQVHFELDLVHDARLTLLDFVPKSASVEKSRFGGSSSFPEASLKFLSCYNCVRLLKSLHDVFWVDPQIFRLYIYGRSSLYIPVGNYVF